MIKIIKNHPKKILFFSGLAGFGGNYLNSKYQEQCLMREYCEEALRYGETILPIEQPPRHITVLLNPAANDGKSKAYYEKYCAPLLHLAGLKVALVKTEREGEAKEIMSVMENTDAVVVAGGDGTLSEVLTGLLRRSDRDICAQVLPLGLIPLGETNTTASALWGFLGKPEAKQIAEATMAVIKEIKRPLDVMEVTPLETEDDVAVKSTFASSQLEWSAFREAHDKMSKYWYWPGLKKYLTYVFSSYKDLSWNCEADIEWISPCAGCKRCREQKMKEEALAKEASKRWWHAFIPITQNNQQKSIDYSNVINEDCGKVEYDTFSNISDFRISTSNTQYTKHSPGHVLTVQLGEENIGTSDFITEGWRREHNKQPQFKTQKLVGQISIRPKASSITKTDDTIREYAIDHENFEVKPVQIKAIPRAVTVFAPPPQIAAVN